MDVIIFALGVLLLALALWDLFETVVVPRPTPGRFRIGRYIVRGSWRGLRAILNARPARSHDTVLGLFAPAATVALLGAWLVTLIVGYGLILFALRDELRPVPPDLGSTVYFAASSVLTLGFGDIVAIDAPARIVVVVAAVTGLGPVALVRDLAAGIAITAFSLLLYALTFNLRDRVARSFALIMMCVVWVFTTKAIGSTTSVDWELNFWLRVQWVGIIFLPAAYMHFSDALLMTTGKPSMGKRRWLIRLLYVFSFFILFSLPTISLLTPLSPASSPSATPGASPSRRKRPSPSVKRDSRIRWYSPWASFTSR